MTAAANRKTHITILVLCFAVFLSCASSCAKKTPKPTEYELAENTAYTRPATREPISDPELLSQLAGIKNAKAFYTNSGPKQLKSPVALIVYDMQEEEYDFGVTDLFETTKDLSEANSIVLLKAGWQSSRVENNDAVRRYEPKISCLIVNPALTVQTGACDFTPGEPIYGDLSYKPHYTAALDEKCFRQLSETVKIAPNAENTYVDVMESLGLFDHRKEIEVLKAACADYDYPQSENISENPGLIDWEAPLFLYSGISYSYLKSTDISAYSTPEALFSDIRQYEAVNETVEAWEKFCSGRTTRLIGLIEYVGGNFAGNYYYENSGSRIPVYAPVYRCTIVDAVTGRAIGWYENDSVSLEEEEIFSSKIKKIGDHYFYDFYHPSKEFLKNVVKKESQTKAILSN